MVMGEISKTQYLKRFPVKFMLLAMRKQQNSLFTNKLRMQDMRHINIKVHMGNGSSATCKQHGILFYKTLHHVLGPCKIVDQLRSMIEYIEEKNAPASR